MTTCAIASRSRLLPLPSKRDTNKGIKPASRPSFLPAVSQPRVAKAQAASTTQSLFSRNKKRDWIRRAKPFFPLNTLIASAEVGSQRALISRKQFAMNPGSLSSSKERIEDASDNSASSTVYVSPRSVISTIRSSVSVWRRRELPISLSASTVSNRMHTLRIRSAGLLDEDAEEGEYGRDVHIARIFRMLSVALFSFPALNISITLLTSSSEGSRTQF
mmetsp:Transcript_17057/g.42735  ORF Transcript_17057/g.42735 Transcript_17057/m.42735 type:complete len:218 (+) Transcript_17057:399-1052(+)